jgi:hypothetical protein
MPTTIGYDADEQRGLQPANQPAAESNPAQAVPARSGTNEQFNQRREALSNLLPGRRRAPLHRFGTGSPAGRDAAVTRGRLRCCQTRPEEGAAVVLEHVDNLLRHLFLTRVPGLTDDDQVGFQPAGRCLARPGGHPHCGRRASQHTGTVDGASAGPASYQIAGRLRPDKASVADGWLWLETPQGRGLRAVGFDRDRRVTFVRHLRHSPSLTWDPLAGSLPA